MSLVKGWLVSITSLQYIPYHHVRGPRHLPVSVIATAVQVLNNFLLGRYQPAWDRRNKLSLKGPMCLLFIRSA